MENAMLKEDEFQDEIMESCIQCGVERLAAYWDEELESYIYLSESDICNKCLAVAASASEMVTENYCSI